MTQRLTVEFLVTHNTGPTSIVSLFQRFLWPRLEALDIYIPKGHKGLAFMQMIVPGHGVIVPARGSSVAWIRGEEETFHFEPYILLEAPTNRVELYGYNSDTTYDHTFFCHFYLGSK